jgi:hypothetical protein
MTSGFTTWDDLERIPGSILVIVNSPIERSRAAMDVLTEVWRVGDQLHVVAPAAWRACLESSSIPPRQIRYAVDSEGRDLELNYFLETPELIAWWSEFQFALVVGTEPHSLYNDEVKTLLEQRVALLLGDGRLLTHSLPERGIYIFDLPAVVARFSREAKAEAYRAWSHALIDDLHGLWIAQGRPGAADNVDRAEMTRRLSAHCGAALLDYDERSPIPFRLNTGVDQNTGAYIRHLRDVIRERDVRQAEMLSDAERNRTAIVAERNDAVDTRDRTIQSLHRELDTPFRRLRRWVRRSPRGSTR